MKLLSIIALVTMLPFAAPSARSQGGVFELGFQMCDDTLEPVPNGMVSVYTGGSGTLYVGDDRGETSFVEYSENSPLTLVFEESPTLMFGLYPATTLGQQFTIPPSELAAFVGTSTGYTYCSPTARQMQLHSSFGEITDGQSGWFVIPHTDAATGLEAIYDFTPWVAELVDTDTISRYLAYSTGSHSTSYQHGVLFRVDQDVDLGESGLILIIDIAGYSYGSPAAPVVQAVYTGSNALGNGMVTTVFGVDSATVAVHVRGILRKGDNLVLFDKASGGGRRYRAANLSEVPGSSPPPPNGSSGYCTVPRPTTANCGVAGSCTPSPPGHAGSCSGISCEPRFVWIGGQVCSSCTQLSELSGCRQWGGGVSAMFGFHEVFSITASGTLSGQVCQSGTAAAGTCRRGFLCLTRCETTCDIVVPVFDYLGGPGYAIIHRTYYCYMGSSVGVMSCTHTDC